MAFLLIILRDTTSNYRSADIAKKYQEFYWKMARISLENGMDIARNCRKKGKDVILTPEERNLARKLEKSLAKRALAEERKMARERDRRKIQLDLEGLNFITFTNFINFAGIPRQ
jgi:hypothetical protein